MKNPAFQVNSIHWMVLTSVSIGIVYFVLVLGTSIIDPTDISWLMKKPDWSQHFLGWHLFRNEAWQFPLGRLASIEHPVGASIGYTDSIPLLAVLFKLFHGVLPEDFQYFGLWLSLCLCLQGLFGALLTRTVSDNLGLQLLGAAFFVASPILLARIGHPALCSHWLLLAALWLYVRRRRVSSPPRFLGSWLTITALAAAIHPYMTFMTLGLAFAFYLRVSLIDHRIEVKSVFVHLGALMVVTLMIWWVLGYFGLGRLGSSYGNFGYGYFSMNLASPISPIGWSHGMWSGGSWSIFLRDWPTATKGQAEGFNYLGMGVIILAMWACYSFKKLPVAPETMKRFLPLLVVCFCFSLLALSHKITFLNYTLVEMELNHYVRAALSPFRSSGRFFWPAYYCLLFLVLSFLIRRNPPKKAALTLSVGLALQLIDFQNVYAAFGELRSSKTEWHGPLKSDLWDQIGKDYKKIVLVPAPQGFDREAQTSYIPFAYFAAKHQMSINSFYLARYNHDASQEYRDRLISDIGSGLVNPDSVYIPNDEYLTVLKSASQTRVTCKTIDGFNVCMSNRGPRQSTTHN